MAILPTADVDSTLSASMSEKKIYRKAFTLKIDESII